MIKKIIISILLVLLGGFLIFSSLVKLEDIDFYQMTLVRQGISNWNMSRFISRLFLAVEMTIGVLLLFQYRLKKITLPLSFGFIFLMTIFLLGRLVFVGNEEDCGCFGESMPLTTLESLTKNGVILLIIALAYRSDAFIQFEKWNLKLVLGIVYLVSLIGIIIYQPPINIYEEFNVDKYEPGQPFPEIPNLDAKAYEGKAIVAFLSPKCSHCRHAAMKVKIMHDKGTDYMLYPVFGFGKEDIEPFMNDVQLETSYTIIPKQIFLSMTQGVFPQIYVLEHGKIKSILNKRQFLEQDF